MNTLMGRIQVGDVLCMPLAELNLLERELYPDMFLVYIRPPSDKPSKYLAIVMGDR